MNFEGNIGPDGPAIFYRKSMFQINSLSCEKIVTDNNEKNNQSFIILDLKHKSSGKLLTVVCLHLKSKSENFQRRESQIKAILKSVAFHCSKYGDLTKHSMLFCGDFNGVPSEDFYKLITEDTVITNLKDAYSINVEEKEPTTIKVRNSKWIRRGIDYIFFSQANFKLCSYLALPTNNEIIEREGLPNQNYSSDHLSLVCDFKFI